MNLNLAHELQARDISVIELAREAGLSPATVYAILAGGKSRALTRRRLREALAKIPLVADTWTPAPELALDSQSDVAPEPEPEAKPRLDGRALLEELKRAPQPEWMRNA